VNNASRRSFLTTGVRGAFLIGLGGVVGAMAKNIGAHSAGQARGPAGGTVWQIDPHKCIACDRCATQCVLDVSAVKCNHAFVMCGYCKLCTGYFEPDPPNLDTGAENQLCPTNAIKRRYVEDPYYEYTIDTPLCIGCAKCVKGCTTFGNGSLYLQIDHSRCLQCNECSIAIACPAQAISRVPATTPYIPKSVESKG
jgi:Na+-translocating ferredoxin:NAD+ oxidoreductase subunit B